MARTIKAAIFPLENIVLFPNTTLPLNIMESHYEEMINTCHKQNIPLAVGLGDPIEHSRSKPGRYLSPRNVMGIGEIEAVHKNQDGTLTVQVRGHGICEIQQYTQQLPFLVAEVSAFFGRPAELSPDSLTLSDGHLEKYRILLSNWIQQEVLDPVYQSWLIKEMARPEAMIHYICTFVVKNPELKQTLLETQSPAEKIRILDAVLAHHLHLDGQSLSRLDSVFADQTVSDQIAAFNHIEKNKAIAQ